MVNKGGVRRSVTKYCTGTVLYRADSPRNVDHLMYENLGWVKMNPF
jgi:hypothetical protein